MKKHFALLIILLFLFGCKQNSSSIESNDSLTLLSAEEYQKAVYASWMGQIVGNTYGLCYEFNYIDNPGPDTFPYTFTWTLDSLRKYNGAFSDDDTDIEYMYLTQMEKNGIEPTYAQLTGAWKTHVKSRVWCANRAAVTLMHAGHYPPATGSVRFNPQWCQIDPQLVNEIWAVTAPGMIRYAVDKSKFSARITNDSFGLEPTLHYAAMYSAAFFEKDLNKLIDIGTQSLPENSRFGKIVEEVKSLYAQYPNDWKASRKIIKEKYYVYADYNKNCWPVIDANLNGAYGIMALLYGKGDFRKTLDYCCAFGMDADNQAATMCGLLGIVNGIESIPHDLLFPIENLNWKEPYNNSYKMITRPGLSDETLTGLAKRIAAQGEKTILAKGGEIIIKEGKSYYKINANASFISPFELNPLPFLSMEVNRPFTYPVYAGGTSDSIVLSLEGKFPEGLKIENNILTGIPTHKGEYTFSIKAVKSNETKMVQVNAKVHTKNLAPEASEIVFNKNAIDKNLELIRDGKMDKTYYSIKAGDLREEDYYGYIWKEAHPISSISFNNGVPQEYCGWFTSFEVEYLYNDRWTKLPTFTCVPEMNLENSQWLKPNLIDYEIHFLPLKTKGIRIKGLAGGLPKDAANAHLGLQFYTSISELKVFPD